MFFKKLIIHDRLGSVRQVINTFGNVVSYYTFDPFGNAIEQGGDSSPFRFAGYLFDDVTGMYTCYQRWYDPHLYRFTARDPIFGQIEDPLSLHKYLYCQNEPVNRLDPVGLLYLPAGWPDYDWETTWDIIRAANTMVGTNLIFGPWEAFGAGGEGRLGEFDYKYTGFTFGISKNVRVAAGEFGNWLAGYTCYYNYGYTGEIGVRAAGHIDALWEYHRMDDLESRYFISAGILAGMEDRWGEGRPARFMSMASFVRAKLELMYIGYYRILGGEFVRSTGDEDIKVSAEFGSDFWWDEIIQLQEFWNAGPSWQRW